MFMISIGFRVTWSPSVHGELRPETVVDVAGDCVLPEDMWPVSSAGSNAGFPGTNSPFCRAPI
jgi:hypothetical protein